MSRQALHSCEGLKFTYMNNAEIIKILFINSPKMRALFLSYVDEQLIELEQSSFDFTLDFHLKRFIEREYSLSKIWNFCKNFNNEIISELTSYKDYPTMVDFINSIPRKLENGKGFTIVDGITILIHYGRSRDLGINEKHKAFVLKSKALKQSENFNQKDLNGLLGATKLFAKGDRKPLEYNPLSVWTVKLK
jgi:hypothetical protein